MCNFEPLLVLVNYLRINIVAPINLYLLCAFHNACSYTENRKHYADGIIDYEALIARLCKIFARRWPQLRSDLNLAWNQTVVEGQLTVVPVQFGLVLT